jgi:hypothetical protein
MTKIYKFIIGFCVLVILPRLIWDFGFDGIKIFIGLMLFFLSFYILFLKRRSDDELKYFIRNGHFKSTTTPQAAGYKIGVKPIHSTQAAGNTTLRDSKPKSEKPVNTENKAHNYNFYQSPSQSSYKPPSHIQSLVLDGSNICCWRNPHERKAQLPILFTICSELFKSKIPFHIFFDANIPHILYSTTESKETLTNAFKAFLSLLNDNITIVPARSRADDFLLQKADRDNSYIISNDNYPQYVGRYGWISTGNRLLKGSIITNRIAIPELSIDPLIVDYVFEGIDLIKNAASHFKYSHTNTQQSQSSASI